MRWRGDDGVGTGPSEVSTNLYESHEFCSYSLKFMFIRGQYVVGGLNRQGAQGASRKEHGVSADGQHSVEAADGTQQDVAYHTYSLLHSLYSFAARARAWGVVAWRAAEYSQLPDGGCAVGRRGRGGRGPLLKPDSHGSLTGTGAAPGHRPLA